MAEAPIEYLPVMPGEPGIFPVYDCPGEWVEVDPDERLFLSSRLRRDGEDVVCYHAVLPLPVSGPNGDRYDWAVLCRTNKAACNIARQRGGRVTPAGSSHGFDASFSMGGGGCGDREDFIIPDPGGQKSRERYVSSHDSRVLGYKYESPD